jgi:NAD(P)-dependent dehydrogenase (short-subunit alcohol dehydrogenase family)
MSVLNLQLHIAATSNLLGQMCEAFLPLLNPERGRVVNVSSGAGKLHRIPGEGLRERFRTAQAISEIDGLMSEFIQDVHNGDWEAKGWPNSTYTVSKAGLTGYNGILAKQNPHLLINACCPGWVKTDMAWNAPPDAKTPTQGAQTPVFLAIADLGGKSGAFWEDEKESSW